MTFPHISVLLDEILQFFEGQQLEYFVDGTLGAGGHSFAFLEKHPEIKKLIGIDQDPIAMEIAKKRLEPWKNRTHFIAGNFENLAHYLDSEGIPFINGMLLDLGVSSMQFDMPEKGFSFSHDGPLDMRMNPNGELTAEKIINQFSETDLGHIFREYGEEKHWRSAARLVVAARQQKPIKTTLELVNVLRPAFSWKKKGVNPLTLIFQGIRIAVNRELEVLERVLPQAIERLAPGARLAVISFHSLEDRIVKNCFRFMADDKYSSSGIGGVFLDKTPIVKLLTKKPISPREEEINLNPRSRSAKLRVIQKL